MEELIESNCETALELGCKDFKQVFRQVDDEGNYQYDILGLDEENLPGIQLLEGAVIGGERIRLSDLSLFM